MADAKTEAREDSPDSIGDRINRERKNPLPFPLSLAEKEPVKLAISLGQAYRGGEGGREHGQEIQSEDAAQGADLDAFEG